MGGDPLASSQRGGKLGLDFHFYQQPKESQVSLPLTHRPPAETQVGTKARPRKTRVPLAPSVPRYTSPAETRSDRLGPPEATNPRILGKWYNQGTMSKGATAQLTKG